MKHHPEVESFMADIAKLPRESQQRFIPVLSTLALDYTRQLLDMPTLTGSVQ